MHCDKEVRVLGFIAVSISVIADFTARHRTMHDRLEGSPKVMYGLRCRRFGT